MSKWLVNQYNLLVGTYYCVWMLLFHWLKMYDLFNYYRIKARKHIDLMY